jgi:5'-nucleotidase
MAVPAVHTSPQRTKILVTNDDGINAPGVLSLVEELARFPERFEVRVACPAEQQSAQSHAITLFEPLWAEPFSFHSGLVHVPAWKVSGTPTDCVKVALRSGLMGGWKPDLVISGINAGQNDGLNVIYSGTCAAALEASIHDIPSIAFSLEYNFATGGVWRYTQSASMAIPIIEAVLSDLTLWKNICCNVNFPNVSEDQVKGYKLTRQGSNSFMDRYVAHRMTDEEKKLHPTRVTYRLEPYLSSKDTDEGQDTVAMRNGWIAVTPISPYAENLLALDTASKIIGWPVFARNPPSSPSL